MIVEYFLWSNKVEKCLRFKGVSRRFCSRFGKVANEQLQNFRESNEKLTQTWSFWNQIKFWWLEVFFFIALKNDFLESLRKFEFEEV